MSDYISFEELTGMSGKNLMERWHAAQFPFDLARCSGCVTQHKYYPGSCGHSSLREQASHLKVAVQPRLQELRMSLAEIYALRMYFRDLYPSTPEPPAEAPVLETVAVK